MTLTSVTHTPLDRTSYGQKMAPFASLQDKEVCYDALFFIRHNLIKPDPYTLGTCQTGGCNLCGDGVRRGDEECECASGTECRFCSNCRLQDGKECTPDAATPCCDDQGMFLTTAASCVKQPEGIKGYCSAGTCAVHTCTVRLTELNGGKTLDLNTFCGVSTVKTCSAMCRERTSSTCYDPISAWGGVDNLRDGSFCTEDGKRGRCVSGECIPIPVTTTPTTTTTTSTTTTTTTSTTTPPAPACQTWCTWHHETWEKKCDKKGVCDACPACFGELTVQFVLVS